MARRWQRRRGHGCQGGDQRVRADRAQHPAGADRIGPHRCRGGGDQRSRAGRDQCASVALRFRPRPLSRHGDGRRLDHRRRPRADRGLGDPQSGRTALEAHRHRDGMHRHLHRCREGENPPRERRQPGAGLGAVEGRRPHRGLQGQPRDPAEGRQRSSRTAPAPPTAWPRWPRCCTRNSASRPGS